jgi:hypothetical protein
MKRLRRASVVARAEAALLLAVSLVLLFIGVRSYGKHEPEGQVELSRVSAVGAYVEHGRLMLIWWRGDWVAAAAASRDPEYWQDVWSYRSDAFVGSLPVPAPWFRWSAEYFRDGTSMRFVVLPVWLVLALVAVYPVSVLGVRPFLRWKRKRHGRCPCCGYDLTGNVSGACPECGTEVKHP